MVRLEFVPCPHPGCDRWVMVDAGGSRITLWSNLGDDHRHPGPGEPGGMFYTNADFYAAVDRYNKKIKEASDE